MSLYKITDSKKALLAACKKYSKIIVTGPRRSGTTFTTRQLAEHLGYQAVYHESFYIHDEDLFIEVLKSKGKKVIQCPTMCHLLHKINLKDTLVIFLKRDLKEIEASINRIHLNDQQNYMRGVHMDEDIFEKSKFLKSDIPNIDFYENVAKIKMDVWDNFLSKKIKHTLELSYGDIERLFPEAWVNKKDRINFLPRQTQADSKTDNLVNKNHELFSSTSADHFCQLFIDNGDGYSEENSIRKRIFSGLNKISFNVETYDEIKALRFDPINDYAIVEFIKVTVLNDDKSYEELEIIDFNGSEIEESKKIIFDHQDANVYLSTPLGKPVAIEIQFDLEKLETTLKYLFEQLKVKNKDATQVLYTKPISETDLLLKKINGKLNLQTGELEYIKSVMSKIKTANKKSDEEASREQSNLINDEDLVKLIKSDDNISSKLDQIESNISEKQLTIKGLLDMTGVEIKSALDKINDTFKANEKNKIIIEDFRKAAIQLDKKNEVLKFQMAEEAKNSKAKNAEILKLSKKIEKLNTDNISLRESAKLLKKNEKSSQTEIKKLIKAKLETENKYNVLNDKYQQLLKDFEALNTDFRLSTEKIEEERAKNESLAEELKHISDIKLQYDKLLQELNFLTGELQE